jgi:predicted Zn-dependent peptidase
MEGYHRPAVTDPDDEVYTALALILGGGRTSRLYRSLVRDKQVASRVAAIPAFPGSKYPSLFVAQAFPAKGRGNDDARDAIRAELEKIKSEEVTDAELASVKARARVELVRSLGSNSGLARFLSRYQSLHGDWRELFRALDRMERVGKADILRVAKAVFTDTNRTVGVIETSGGAAAAPAGW